MSDDSSLLDLKLAAANRRLEAVEQVALRVPEPGRSLVLSIVGSEEQAIPLANSPVPR